ncbi:hypothetical protein HPP92_028884 [Vanilla planifolia]|uniref:Uncharacterized protein n=1 Tax=Vanilla planifolia TaxID=51239 RepID=A0A835U4Z9_VANPL|nr:hypothetical protein HPP92_028884 [Vanilla planifolia]KAG0446345.1 hypothetical protein HPP92_028873 [Vanilla planifolia]
MKRITAFPKRYQEKDMTLDVACIMGSTATFFRFLSKTSVHRVLVRSNKTSFVLGSQLWNNVENKFWPLGAKVQAFQTRKKAKENRGLEDGGDETNDRLENKVGGQSQVIALGKNITNVHP